MKPCRLCSTPTPDAVKRWVEGAGFCCVDCHAFLTYAERLSKRLGIGGNPMPKVQ